ncbi:hypothetical protein SYNTR_0960 [Candidatus Syntrophocurvum alkaliphilum]|uniref:Histidinol-phosphate aminotransferase n=1 Tax=Candidatus Syntrophocurvum alkaliphilum TaxID=2293317 RepID=A0A6I6DGV9_9FIRM|nr:histidinol-phosphate transaminase [Candidatus Syntrophocurvum alkaliphilum]QGT99553.1 hypothetical protein SYNTR_0960 [Candidatus Syntrophocurvum alkaliphilum]
MNEFIKKKGRKEIFDLKPYVPGKPIEEVKRELGIDDIIKLASNENPIGPSPKGVEAVEKALAQLHFYPDSNCFYLKNRLSEILGYENENLIIGNGSDEVLKLIAETFINQGDEVVFADPSFVEYEFTAKIMGAACIKVNLKDFTHDLEAMLQAITDKTKIVYICNPNNPTGTIVTEQEMDYFMNNVPEDVLVVFDEAYVEYVEAENFASGLKYVDQGKNALVLRTFSKIYGLAALRIGYAITTKEIAQAIERVIEPFNVNMLAQVAALAAIDDHEHVKKSQNLNSEGKQYLYKEFKNLGFDYVPTEANFIFVDTHKDIQFIFNKLLQLGVIIRTGDIFGYPTYMRLTIGTKQENERLINALKAILEE